MTFKFMYQNETIKEVIGNKRIVKDNVIEYELLNSLIDKQIDYISFKLNEEDIYSGEEGFYLVPGGNREFTNQAYAVGYYKKREDISFTFKDVFMPVFGFKHKNLCRTVIVEGMQYDVCEVISIENDKYNFELRWYVKNTNFYENIKLQVHDILDKEADYSDMARIYRNYQLEHGFKSIKDRITPSLAYAVESPNIRVRMGWKPVPCKVYEQTIENEPPMHVACTFYDLIKLMEEYKKIGVEKAEFCLVGWNIKGHDGRWPQAFPIEESLGGKEGLLKLIKRAKELGYKICCHTNSTDVYTIADCYNDNLVVEDKEGRIVVDTTHWAGGRAYQFCPRRAYETLDDMLMPITELGFDGTHYIDVITCIAPRVCFSKEHSTNKKESIEYWNKLLKRSKELFGSVGSEGAYDHSLKYCDTTLYASFYDYKKEKDRVHFLSDETIPFWQLVYHGIILSNPYARTINAILSEDKDDLLKIIEYGGRPHIYYYAHFVDDGSDWIGRNDFYCHSDEERYNSALKIKETMDIMNKFSYLQYEFMEKHKKISEGKYVITYSDGSEIIVDYNEKTYFLRKKTK